MELNKSNRDSETVSTGEKIWKYGWPETIKWPFILICLWVFRQTFLLQGNVGGVALNKYVLFQIAIVFSLLFYLLRRGWTFLMLMRYPTVFWLGLLYVWGMASIAWSVMPFMSFYFAFEYLVLLTGILYICVQQKSFYKLECGFIWFGIVYLIVRIVFRQIMMGIGFHDLNVATIGSILFLYCLAEGDTDRPMSNKKAINCGKIIGFIGLLAGTSSGANVATICGLAVIAFFAKSYAIRLLGLLGIIGLVIFTFSMGGFEEVIQVIFPGKSMRTIENANGRTVIWEAIIMLAEQRPWTGWGFAACERILPDYATDSHNSFVGCLGSLGYIGVFWLALAFLSFMFRNFIHRHLFGYRGLFAASVAIFVNANTIGFFTSKCGNPMIYILMVVALTVIYSKVQPSEDELLSLSSIKR